MLIFLFLYVFNFFYKKVIIRYSKPFQATGSPQSSPEVSHPAHFYRKTARDPQKDGIAGSFSIFLLGMLPGLFCFVHADIIEEPAGELAGNGCAGELDLSGCIRVVDCQGLRIELACRNAAEGLRSHS